MSYCVRLVHLDIFPNYKEKERAVHADTICGPPQYCTQSPRDGQTDGV